MSQQFFESEPREEVANYCSFCGSRFLPNETRCAACGRIRASKRISKVPSVPWKKVLHERQPYDDNYLDETFLSSLVSQETSAKLTYPQVVMQAIEVSLAAGFVSLYLLVFMGMLNKLVDSTIVVSVNGLILLTGVVVSVLLSPKIVKLKKIFMNFKSGAIVIGFVLLLSPMIQTFFQNYAENTTYAISYGLVLIHLITRDYSYVYSKENRTRMDWSTLAIMYLTVILGSRLNGEKHDVVEVFTLWLTTLTLFVFARTFQKTLREYSIKVYNYTALTFIIGMGVVIYSISKIGIIVYALTNFIIFFIGPLGLVWFYQYKNVIHGPWDLPDVKQFEE